MATSTQQRVEQQLDKVHQLGPEEARAKITAFPTQVTYEARYALQQVKEQVREPQQMVEIIEPLARAIGWVEALSFALDTSKERETYKQMNPQGGKFN